MRAGGEASPREAKMASSSCLLRFRFFSAAQLGAESVPRRRWTNNFLPSLQSLFCPFSALQFSTRGSHPSCFIHSTLLGAEKKAKGAGTEWEEKRQNKAESFFPFFSSFLFLLCCPAAPASPGARSGPLGTPSRVSEEELAAAGSRLFLPLDVCVRRGSGRAEGEREARRGERSESGRAIEFLCKVSLVRFFVSFQTPSGKRPFPRSLLLLLLLLLLSSLLPTALPLLPPALYFISI